MLFSFEFYNPQVWILTKFGNRHCIAVVWFMNCRTKIEVPALLSQLVGCLCLHSEVGRFSFPWTLSKKSNQQKEKNEISLNSESIPTL